MNNVDVILCLQNKHTISIQIVVNLQPLEAIQWFFVALGGKMKRILVAIFSVFMAFGVARADCASNEFAVDDECVESKFQVTTTNLDADATFDFVLTPRGTFYIDCGADGTLSGPNVSGRKVVRTSATKNQTYTCTYNTAGVKTIKFGGVATAYNTYGNAIRMQSPTMVAGISGSLGRLFPTIGDGITATAQPWFASVFSGCTNLTGPIPNGLFDGIYGAPRASMFQNTFSGCANLGRDSVGGTPTYGIPSGLFGNLTGDPAYHMFESTFSGCSGLTGSIPANLFGNLSGTPQETMFFATFSGCSNLTGPIPSGLFGNLTGAPAANMFWNTFNGCTNLGRDSIGGTPTYGIPSGLFGNLSGAPQLQMFRQTFNGCSGLTGPIPASLFGDIYGAPVVYMFNSTFRNCSGLTGSIPANLFGNFVGASANQMFRSVFEGCRGLTGYVPKDMFENITTSNSMAVYQMFSNTNLYTTVQGCPCGTKPAETGWGATTVDGFVVCEVGAKDNEHWNNGVCTTDCTGAGVSALKTSTGLSYPLLTDATAPQNIHIKVNNKICTVPLENGAANNAINMRWNGNTYHATVPDEIVPAGFTGQPE